VDPVMAMANVAIEPIRTQDARRAVQARCACGINAS
jgi:hypothetical protein